jgi:hypothetical protein
MSHPFCRPALHSTDRALRFRCRALHQAHARLLELIHGHPCSSGVLTLLAQAANAAESAEMVPQDPKLQAQLARSALGCIRDAGRLAKMEARALRERQS